MDRPLTLMRGVIRGADSTSIRRGSIARGTWPRIWGFVRPYRRWLLSYLALTTVTAVIGVATPVLAGRVVNTIVAANDLPDAARVVMVIAGAIAGMAVLEAVVGLTGRWFSARLGEGLIEDLRVAVFRHVQSMPLAFFSRTRTGALVSRLNNDVIGAQTAITGTLSTVLSNSIQLVLAVAVMIGLAWQVTVLAMLLLPVFVLPARRMGTWLAELRREAAELNATMGNQMTERFSAPGATLVKLFGDPDSEASVFRGQVSRVRDIGVRSAMVSRLFVTALQLVSALA